MAEYLLRNGSEVENMLYYEWKEEEAIKYAKEEGYEEGIAHGIEHGAAQERVNNIRALKKVLSPEQIAETLQLPKEYVLEVLQSAEPTTE